LDCLLKWFAPILVFTTDEIYSLACKDKKNIHEYKFPELSKKLYNSTLNEKWKQLFKIKEKANIAIEEKRASKEIGSSLEADIEITADKKSFELLEGLDLAEYFITSKAEKFQSKNKDEFKIKVVKAKGNKCPRCWKILESKCLRCEKISNENI